MFQGITAIRGKGTNVLVVQRQSPAEPVEGGRGLQKIDLVKAARGKDDVQERTMSKPLAHRGE
jgi:hypothetical protein